MSWKKHFRVVNAGPAPAIPQTTDSGGAGTSSKYASYLPEVYAGHPNRIQRYYQYDDMDRDSDINAALDTIADFCTQSEEQNEQPFLVQYNGDANETEVRLLKESLTKWVKLNDFKARLWYIFRGALKNGDQFFLRDPETAEWLWVDHYSVEMVKVDETAGKKPDEYLIRGLDPNRNAKFATKQADPTQYRSPFGTSNVGAARTMAPMGNTSNVFSLAGAGRDPRMLRMNNSTNELQVVDADHVVHLSLSVGMDINWPFGQSVLEPVFKTYKQKELLEDSIIIYRVQRAPERRIFYIDVGNMPPVRAKAHIEQIKNEIHQRRIPNRTGGGSSIMDAAYNPLCLAMDTKVPLLDGRTLTIAELADEHANGKENWVYSCDPITGAVMPGNITWAGVTRKDAKVIRIHLDNGETLTCTPDHKIPVLGRGFVEAKDLTPADSLVAFNTREKNIDRKKKNVRTYTQVYDHAEKEWVYAHRMVGEFFRTRGKHQEFTFLPENASAVKQTIHHKDYDRYNNDPRNLTYMNRDDHVAYHVFKKRDYWQRLPAAEAARIRQKISGSLSTYFESMSTEDRARFSELCSTRNRKWIAEKRESDPEGWKSWRSRVGQGNSAFFKANPEAGIARAKKRLASGTNTYKNQPLIVTQRMVGMIVDEVKLDQPNRIETARRLSDNAAFMDELRAANPALAGHANKIDYEKISPVKLDLLVEKAGYKDWRDFTRKIANYNHRIVRIEEVAEILDVGTVTIDAQERWHGHHTFATSAGIFVKNSIVEDYFFAQGSEGRGSKVETLPGGDATGEITDLTFFAKKLARGLRIPPAYLSLGSDDGNIAFNDGKLGQALIQEFRFSKYCMRLQALMAPIFDREFKRFLREGGIEIESSLFELAFNPPQNFTKYRQIELDSQQVQIYTQVQDNRRLAERFKLKRFLNLSEEELIENETLWKEENASKMKRATGSSAAETDVTTDLSSVGIRPPSDMDMGPPPDEMSPGDMNAPPPDGGAPPPPPDAAGGVQINKTPA